MPTFPVDVMRMRSVPSVLTATMPGLGDQIPVLLSLLNEYAGAPTEPIGFASSGKLTAAEPVATVVQLLA